MKKKLLSILMILMIAVFALPCGKAFAATKMPYAVDNYGALTSSELSNINNKLAEISATHNVDCMLLIENAVPEEYYGQHFDADGDMALMYYGADYLDYLCQSNSAICFVIDMNKRQWAFVTSGAGFYAFTDYGQDILRDNIKPDLSEGNYNTAFETYARLCNVFLTEYETNGAYDVDHTYKAPFEFGIWALIALFLGFLIGLIRAAINKGQLKSVAPKTEALDCVVPGSLVLTKQRDFFLYKKVTQTLRESSESKGGSSSFTSSSGSSHGGSHGSF